MTQNTLYKDKSQLRVETEDAVQKFLKAGGTIEVCKPSRRGAKAGRKMKAVGTRQPSRGSSGFAAGFPKRSVGA